MHANNLSWTYNHEDALFVSWPITGLVFIMKTESVTLNHYSLMSKITCYHRDLCMQYQRYRAYRDKYFLVYLLLK